MADRPLTLDGAGEHAKEGGHGHRDIWDGSANKWRRLPVFQRQSLMRGQNLAGPLVIEEASSTLVIPEGAVVSCDALGNLIVDLKAAQISRDEYGAEKISRAG